MVLLDVRDYANKNAKYTLFWYKHDRGLLTEWTTQGPEMQPYFQNWGVYYVCSVRISRIITFPY